MLECTFSLQSTGDKYHIAVPTIVDSMKRWKIILKLQFRQTAPVGQAGKIQTGWVVCKMGRKLAKRLHPEWWSECVQLWSPQFKKETKKGEKLQRSAMTWPLRSDRRRSLLCRTEASGGISSHYSSNYSWVTTNRTWGTTWRRKREMVTIYSRKGFIPL